MPDTLNHVKPVQDTIKVDAAAVSTLSPVPENLKADTTKAALSDIPTQTRTKPVDGYTTQLETSDSNIIAPQTTIKRTPARPETDPTAVYETPNAQISNVQISNVQISDTQISGKVRLNSELEIAPIIDHRIAPLKQLRQVAPFEIYGNESTSPNAYFGNALVHNTVDTRDEHSYKSAAVVGLILVFVLLLIFSGKYVPDMFRTAYSHRLSGKRYAENYKSDTHAGTYFVLFCALILPFFVFACLSSRGIVEADYSHLGTMYPILIGVWLLQSAATKICSAVARVESLVGEINFNKRLMAGVVGIVLFPVVLALLLYDEPRLYDASLTIGMTILAVLIISMIIRIFTVFFEARISAFRFFLYLCAFEISPYLALYIVFK